MICCWADNQRTLIFPLMPDPVRFENSFETVAPLADVFVLFRSFLVARKLKFQPCVHSVNLILMDQMPYLLQTTLTVVYGKMPCVVILR